MRMGMGFPVPTTGIPRESHGNGNGYFFMDVCQNSHRSTRCECNQIKWFQISDVWKKLTLSMWYEVWVEILRQLIDWLHFEHLSSVDYSVTNVIHQSDGNKNVSELGMLRCTSVLPTSTLGASNVPHKMHYRPFTILLWYDIGLLTVPISAGICHWRRCPVSYLDYDDDNNDNN